MIVRWTTVMLLAGGVSAATLAEQYILLTGGNAERYPAVARPVAPIPGPGFPGTFYDGDRLAGTADDGPAIAFQGVGVPYFKPNQFGALSFIFRRGSVPIGGPNLVPYMGIEFLGGPRLDLDGDPTDGGRSLVPVSGKDPVVVKGPPSYLELRLDPNALKVELVHVDITGTNEGAPGVSAKTATVLVTLAGTSLSGEPGAAINPAVDHRISTLTPVPGTSASYSIDALGFELWEDSIDPGSSTASTLGTFQQLGTARGWLLHRGDLALVDGKLGTTLWPKVETSAVGQSYGSSEGGSVTIASGVGGDNFAAPGNGGLPLTDFGGQLSAYLKSIVLTPNAYRLLYLEAAGFGLNNSADPVFQDTIGYDLVIIAAGICLGDVNGDGYVGQQDLGVLLAAYGHSVGDPGYYEFADFNGDGTVNQIDLGLLLSNYDVHCH
jgi:hypothetical protein